MAERYGGEVFETLEDSERSKLESLCFAIKGAIDNGVCPIGEESARELTRVVNETLDEAFRSDISENLSSEKAKEINALCAMYIHAERGGGRPEE